MRKIFFFFWLVIIAVPSFSQLSKKDIKKQRHDSINAVFQREKEEGIIAYPKHTAVGIKLLSDGYAGSLEIGRAKSIKKMLLYQVEFGERKNLKEQKYSTDVPSTTSFVYGKQNFFYYLKTGVQQQYLLANKGNKSGVNISANWGGGISFGLLRPYLIQIFDGTDETTTYQSWDSRLKDTAASEKLVIGGPSLSEGWSGLRIIPGLYGKGGVRFDFAHSGSVLTALEIGVSGELYVKNMPQMLRAKQKQGFASIYLTLLFGGRSRY